MTQAAAPSIVIAGGGTAGWMAAAILSRFLDRTPITLVESEAIGTVGVGESTIPQIHLFNSGLGLDEGEFLRETKATFKLGVEFDGWNGPGSRYMHAFGFVGRAVGIVPFRQLWLRAKAEGFAQPLGDYNFNAVAAHAGRMVGPGQATHSLRDLVYAYQFDASLYGSFLRRIAEAAGVRRIEGRIDHVKRDGESGDIVALELDGGFSVKGDFFIDCSGFRSLLLGQSLGVEFDDWSSNLPCNRALAVPSVNGPNFRPFTQAMARKAGWQWRIPLQHRTGNGHVYCSDFLSDDEAAANLLDTLEGEALAEPRQLRFTAGRRKVAWSHNCVGVGLAAGFLEPLESTSIHLIQTTLARLINFLPSERSTPMARLIFNRQTATEWRQIRDFLILHFHANGRAGEPFWDYCRSMQLPDTLAEKIALFEETGLIVREEGDLFTEEAWTQVLIGQGVVPGSVPGLGFSVDAGDLKAFMEGLADAYRRKVATLPTHAEYLASLIGAPAEVIGSVA